MKNTTLYSILAITLCFLSACSPNETVQNKSESGVVTEKYTRNKETLAKDGLYEAFAENGKLVESAQYTNDQLNGERRLYNEEGVLEIIEHYSNGKYEGDYEVFYANGQQKQKGAYSNDMAQGEWKTFYPNGKLKETVVIVDGEENGPFKEYSEKGILTAEGAYNGTDKDIGTPKEHGTLKIYDEITGDLVKEMKCNYGVCNTVWKKEGYEEELEIEAELN